MNSCSQRGRWSLVLGVALSASQVGCPMIGFSEPVRPSLVVGSPPQAPERDPWNEPFDAPVRWTKALPDWEIVALDARGHFGAIAGMRRTGGRGGQGPWTTAVARVDLDRQGEIDWTAAIGKDPNDARSVYSVHAAADGGLLVGFVGYGEKLTGQKGPPNAGIVARFDGAGRLLFATRLESEEDVRPGVSYSVQSPYVASGKYTYATATFLRWKPGEQSLEYAGKLFAIDAGGQIVWRRDMNSTYGPSVAPDGAVWAGSAAGGVIRYSADGDVLDEWAPPEDLRLQWPFPVSADQAFVSAERVTYAERDPRRFSDVVLSARRGQPLTIVEDSLRDGMRLSNGGIQPFGERPWFVQSRDGQTFVRPVGDHGLGSPLRLPGKLRLSVLLSTSALATAYKDGAAELVLYGLPAQAARE